MNGVTINFKPSSKQYKALQYLQDDETLFCGYGGAAFSGKSYLACYWLTIMCVAFPGTAWGLGRKELTTLKKTTLLTLFKVFSECNITADRHYNYNQQSNIITFENNSQIFLIDMAYKPSDPLYTRFGGLELTGAAVDESAETQYKAIEILFTRLGRRNNHKYGLSKKLLETFNPSKDHIYRRYYKPYSEGKEKKGVVFVPALPKDNPSPEVDDYIKDIIATADKVTIQRLIYGNFEYDDDPTLLIDYQKLADIWTNEFVEEGEKYITADIARFGKDSTTIGYWNGWRLEEIHVYNKASITESSNIIKALATRKQVPMSQIIVDEDGVGGGVVDILKCKGFVNNSSPLKDPKTNKVDNFNNLKSQCYFHLAERINKSEVYVCDTEYADKLTEELEQVKQYNMDKDTKKMIIPKDKVKENIGRSPDFSDMMMMRSFFYYLKTFDYAIY